VDESQVTPEADISHDLGADSLDSIELCMKLEKEFLIGINDSDWENVKTVSDAVTLVRGLVPNLEPVQDETTN
jgi:acyl carrier protein